MTSSDAPHARNVHSPIPARTKHQDSDNGIHVNGLGRAKRWCQPYSHCGTEQPFAQYADDWDWNDAVTQLVTVQRTWQKTHATTTAGQVCLSLSAASLARFLHPVYQPVDPSNLAVTASTSTPSLHIPLPCPPCILLLLERIDLTGEVPVDVTGCSYLIAGLWTGVARWCM